jgi:hypothetical protein
VKIKTLHVRTSPLTNRIFVGYVLKDGRTWEEGKQDVTGEVCGAVCEHVMANGAPIIVSLNGVPKYEIAIRDIGGNGK